MIVDFAYSKGLTGSHSPFGIFFIIKKIGDKDRSTRKKKIRAEINNIKAEKDNNTNTANGGDNSIIKILSIVLIKTLFLKLIFIFCPF